MGIRFDCPNGHQLNVKAFLAGRRGFCPECGVSLLIPLENRQALESDDTPARSQGNHTVEVKVEHTRATTNPRYLAAQRRRSRRSASEACLPGAGVETATIASLGDPVEPVTDIATEVVWYVRPPAGGQYGPASDAALARWIKEGRIVRDTYVWRTGWADWRPVGEVVEQLPAPLAGRAEASVPTRSGQPVESPVDSAVATSAEVRRSRRRSTRRHWLAAVVLMLLVVVLSGLLILVL